MSKKSKSHLKSSPQIIAETNPKRSTRDEREEQNVCVRKIDNGYLLCRSYSNGNEYHRSETFHADRPDLGELGPERIGPGNELMRDAVRILK